MSNEILYAFRFEECSYREAGELAEELLSSQELPHSTYLDRESKKLYHTVYAVEPALRTQYRASFSALLPMWQDLGLKIGEITEFDLKKEDWAEAWKNFFKPLEVSDRLIVRPSWHNEPVKPGQKILTLDPGLSFGTGQHPTTFYCLQQLDRYAAPDSCLLDAGCGTGILAMSAALLNYRKVTAFDYDPDAVEVAKENCAMNHITSFVPFVANAADYPGEAGGYDVVCANLLAQLLIAFRKNISSWVKPETGKLILAGILAEEFILVRRAFEKDGFEFIDTRIIGEWQSGTAVLHG